MKTILAAVSIFALASCATGPSDAQSFSTSGKSLREVYEYLHANPELSFQEKNSSRILATEMRSLGFTVTENVGDEWVKARAMKDFGKIEDGVGGYGVVAVLKNGDGPTVMIRADMDGLPVVEETGRTYASKKRDVTWNGVEGGVMHACGHDVHMTSWLGTARNLVARKDEWSGTLVMILQPAEEIGLGALSMLESGLFEDFPRPDFNIALHDNAALPAGMIAWAPGFVMANVDSVDIHVKGRGGHGAYPHDTIDPVVIAARIVTSLQTLVSRELNPQEAGVVTVGAFNAGTKHNIIPNDVNLMLTVRSYSDETRDKLLSGIERIAKGEAMVAGLEGDMLPEVTFSDHYTPAGYNNPELTARLKPVLESVVGAENLHEATPTMGGEDFARYGRAEPRIPSMMFWLGAVPMDAWLESQKPGGKPLPSLHSSEFYPDPDPTLDTGVKAMTAAALELLN